MTHHPKYDHKHSCVWKNYWLSLLIVPECHNVQTPCSEGTACSKLTLSVLYRAWSWVWISLCTKTWWRMLIYIFHPFQIYPKDILNGLVIHAVCSRPFILWCGAGQTIHPVVSSQLRQAHQMQSRLTRSLMKTENDTSTFLLFFLWYSLQFLYFSLLYFLNILNIAYVV